VTAGNSTEHRDFWNVVREDIGSIDYLTPWAHATNSGDQAKITRESVRLDRLFKRLGF
jgi:hypothetical protein